MSRRLQRRLAAEDGAVTIIVALLLVVLLGVSALVVDLGRTRHARQQLQDAVDSASIAAADYLPARDAARADEIKALAAKITTGSTVGTVAADVTTTFSCVLRYPLNTPGGSSPDLGTTVGHACGPATAGAWNTGAGWVIKGSRATHACDPYVGDMCNAVKVSTAQTVNYLFAPAIGIPTGSTGAVQSVACYGACKPTGSPLDIALVLDRTGSMSPQDIADLKNAALELLKVYNASQQDVAMLALPYPQVADKCKVASPQNYPDPSAGTWLAVPLSNDYKDAAGNLNPSSALVTGINCLERAASPTIMVAGNRSPSQSHTNLGDPIAAAAAFLRQTGRPTVPDVVVFMTDGEANQPWDPARGYDRPCSYANDRASIAKTTGVLGQGLAEVYTVGYRLGGITCGDQGGTYRNGGTRDKATQLLADMATNSIDNSTAADCVVENTDSDHFFCVGATNSLAAVFKQVAIASVKYSRLIDVD